MITLQKKYHMHNLINSLAEGWRGLFVTGGSYGVAMISAEMSFSIFQLVSLSVGILVGILTLIGQVQKQIDRYKSKTGKK